ncbi:uncharacterized protein LOC110382155 [Helicoverpa armigera]|uniref:uncharacterized protein LOC110382155 n=1 Tax=Helicoverpa armigera TaxID=29058 RepID=UPI003083D48A
MNNFTGYYKSSNTTEFLINLNKFGFIFGLPNFWIEELDFPDTFLKMIGRLNKYGNWLIFGLILAEYGAYFTQKNLDDRQTSDLILFIISHTIITGFRVRISHQEVQIRNVMYKLGIALKEVYNDSEAEDQMIKRSKFFSYALVLNCIMSVLMYTVAAVMRVIRAGLTFTTVITVYPTLEDRSVWSDVVRAIFYIIWCIYLTRVFAVYTLVICLTIAMSHQFKNITSYFYSLSNIFEDEQMTQTEKELEYERSFRAGIKIHSETLNCTGDIQRICRDVFSGQIIFNLTLLIVLMYQMVNSPRNLTNALTLVIAGLTILLSTGFFMWNAGDITVEAQLLPTAMFSSGWENCGRDSSVRVRKLIVIAMMRAQEPVVLTGFGIIALSYQSYVSIVKSSYSVFSVLVSHKDVQIRNVVYKLGIALKEEFNDSQAEDQMIRRSKFFSWALILNCVLSLLMYTVEAVMRVIRAGATYTTVITAYPDVDDRSTLSHVVRVIAYIIWCIYLTRIFAVYSLVISLTIAMSYQFKNLTSYFCNLSKIFEDERMTQTEKEQEYERAFRVGIKIHSETLKCTEDIQAICRDVFSGQIIFNILMLIVLMHQMVNSARNLTNAVTLVMAALTILLSTGFFMWNAGDITVEAQLLPTAMFSSGWENCGRDSSVRVRKLIVIAMMQAQEPVVLTGLGIIALSYQSYVSIVKSSYSVFSVLY